MTAPKPVEQVARDADAIGYVRGLGNAANWTRAFDQDLPDFDRPTCVRLAKGLAEMARHAGERLGVAVDYNEPPAPLIHHCCVHDEHGDSAREVPPDTATEAAIAWLKRQRDEYPPASEAWIALDGAVDSLRDHYYTGTPLGEDVQGPWAEVDR